MSVKMSYQENSFCSLCKHATQMICVECGNLSLCFICAEKRHQFGSLTTHKFRFVNYSKVLLENQNGLCLVCNESEINTQCPLCVMSFCSVCAETFHSVGTAQAHTEHFISTCLSPASQRQMSRFLATIDSEEVENDHSSLLITANAHPGPLRSVVLSDDDDDPTVGNIDASVLSALSVSNLEIPKNKRGSLLFDGVSNLSFRLLNCALDAKPDVLKTENPNSLFLCLDRSKRTISIFEKPLPGNNAGGTKMTCLHLRPLRFVKSVIHAGGDSKHFSISFHIAKQTLECYAPSVEDATAICKVLHEIAVAEAQMTRDLSHCWLAGVAAGAAESIAVLDTTLFEFRGFKKGSLQWAERWFILKRKCLFVYRSSESSIPINSIALQGPQGSPLLPSALQRAGHKVIMISSGDREYSLKMMSEAERDTVWTLLLEACFSIATDFSECQRKLLADEQTLQSDRPSLTSAITSDTAGELTEDFSTILNSTIPGVVMGSAGSSSVPRRSMIFQAQPCAVLPLCLSSSPSRLVATASDRRARVRQWDTQLRSDNIRLTKESRREQRPPPMQNGNNSAGAGISGNSAASAAGTDEVSYKIDFIEENLSTTNIAYTAAPASSRHTVYWLMNLMGRSMTTGAFLTPSLFLSKQIWLQANVKFHAYVQKKENFIQLHALLAQLVHENQNIGDRNSELKNSLVEIGIELEVIQNNLCTHLSYVPEIKKTNKGGWGDSIARITHSLVKKATRAVSGCVKVDDCSDYINIIRDICIQTQILDAWISHFESCTDAAAETILMLMSRITDFLQSVFLGVVIRDMKMLLSRYSKHCSRSLVSAV